MYLKRIEIAGFKSFAERTVIEFDRGLTAVVGPNGSGKSNITEAIRWVLGEQSAKSLRGGRMPDVIFAGTTKRKPLNIAEVTVVLDNEERSLPLDFSEVSVTRRLKRTGESDFFINKQSCRLKDIVDLFMDSGLGKESFSIISQGKVEAIFNSKPEDRRGIFEEAAGVLKYKQRKRQAEQKLFETEDNLNRVQDIIYELEGQLEPLAAQSEDAKKYLQLKEQLTSIDVGVTVAEIDQLKEQWHVRESRLGEVNQTLKVVSGVIGNAEQLLVSLRDKRAKLDQTLDQDQQQLLAVTEAYEQAEGQKNVLLERAKNTEKTTSDYDQNLQVMTKRVEGYEAEAKSLAEDVRQKESEKKELAQQIQALVDEVALYSKSAKERLAELRSDYVELMQQQAKTSNDLKHLVSEYDKESSKNKVALNQQQELLEKQSELAKKAEQAERRCREQGLKLADLRTEFINVQKKATHMKQELAVKEKQMYDAMGTLQQAKAREKSLQELQENYAGFYQGVRAVLKAKNELTGIVGAVAELITVPKDLALGIETALGGAAQNVIVENEQHGRAAIAFLKKNRLGRATFLPLTTIKPRRLNQAVQETLKGTAGFIGIASELVTFAPLIRPVIENLLGVTLLARDLSSASQIAKQVGYQYRVVSLEGDVMNPGGSMTGGATRKGNQGNLFVQAGELQSLIKQVAQMESELAAREVFVRDLKVAVSEVDEALENLRLAGETARLQEQELKNKQELIEAATAQLSREQLAFEQESKGLTNFLAEYETQKQQLEQALTVIQTNRQRLDSEMSQTDELEAINTAKREKAQEELKRKQAQFAVMTEKIRHLVQLTADKEQQLRTSQAEAKELRTQIRALTDNHSTHQLSQDTIKGKMTELQSQKESLQNSLLLLKSERADLQQQMAELDKELIDANKQQQQFLGEKATAEVAKSRAEVGMDNALQHLQENYNLTYEAGRDLYPLVVTFELAKGKIRGLKREIDALGPVNMSAIEQHESVNERYTFLVAQRDDLLTAKDSLFDTMSEMDAVVKVKFEEVFTAIRGKFQVVFPNMFGGGHADLVLTDPSDLLNTGIEIVAQPPGKKLQSLSLLSGGERALTAIALLFSIIQVRPVPFCVLDEVEAALDEANVTRFGQYLSSFEDDTQFIVITHRKGTMEAADVLYGVTMQESGVSKIVSVRLEEINERGDIEGEHV